MIWSICQDCKYFNSFSDKNGQEIDFESDDFNIDFNGVVDCDKAKDYLIIKEGVILLCPGYEGV